MASTELQPAQVDVAPRSPTFGMPRVAARLAALRAVRLPWWRDLAALLALLGCTVVVYWPTLLGIGLYARSDTYTFFFPVFATLHRSLREGALPLWESGIFGGFPLFAEGQIGALYPPNVLAALLLPSALDGFLALRVFHVVVAALGAYALARSLGCSPLGSCVAGLVFGFGSFVVGQQHHANLVAAGVWLPLALACVELALRRPRWTSHGYLALAGLLLGLQALASHVQPVMLGGALLVAYIPARQVAACLSGWRDVPDRAERRRTVIGAVLLGGWALVVVPVLGAAIAAAQLLPLHELSRESWRTAGWSYQDAVEYSFPPPNFLTLLFPYFFRTADGGQWSLWQAWEVVLYVGVVPLLLGLLALARTRHWSVAFFGVVAVVSGLLALGGYAPFGLYELLRTLPGMDLQRAPARFTFLTGLALAMLAAHGADRLRLVGGDRPGDADPPVGARRSRELLVLQLATAAWLVGVLVQLASWRGWLQGDRAGALQFLADSYLRLPRDPLQALTPVQVHAALEGALDLANPKTALSLLLLGGLVVLLGCWRELPRLARVWSGALLLLVAVDLVLFAADFHPLIAADELVAVGPVGEYLAGNAGSSRALTMPDVEGPRPNQLLPVLVAEAGGYSPLHLDRHRWYSAAIGTVGNTLLDLMNVGYVVRSAEIPALPSYQQVAYHPRRPLMVGGASTPNGRLALEVPGESATELRMVAALVDGASIPDGELVGEWILTDREGVRRALPVRAGRELADWTFGQPGVRTAHRPVQAAGVIPIRVAETDGDQPRTLSYAAIRLDGPRALTGAEYRHRHPSGRTVLYGMALFDARTERIGQFYRPAKYQPAFRDGDTLVWENRAAFPRAFVVPEAVEVPDGPSAMERLMHGPFDPARQVLVEPGGRGELASAERPAPPAPPSAPAPRTDLVPARVERDTSSSLTVQATTADGGYLVVSDAYYPGWRAAVDGREVDVLRANYLFRAVPLPAGEHEVVFWFDPPPLRRGAVISAVGLGAATILAAVGLGGGAPPARRRRRDQTV